MSDPSPAQPLPRNFRIYFPIDCAGGAEFCATVEGILCERLGGVTSYPARGTFKMRGGERISERLQVLESFCEADDWSKQQSFLLSLTAMIGAILNQETIACAVDGRMQMVPPETPGRRIRGVPPSAISEEDLLKLIRENCERE